MRNSTQLLLSLLLVVTGCGVRTGLELHSDAGDTGLSRDSGPGPSDMGPPRDAGPCSSDIQCDDRQICNGNERCVAGHCASGMPLNCTDGIECTSDQCIEGAGCVSRPNDMSCPPGLRCAPEAGGCVPNTMRCMTSADCDDHQMCNGTESCDPSTGTCFAGPPMFCGDAVSCTDDQCVEGFGCVHTANSAECPLNSICSPLLGCQMRMCGATGGCDDRDPCNGIEFCSADGVCHPGSPLNCNDGNSCTVDFCLTGMGCVSQPTPEICGDFVDNDCNGLTDCSDPACGFGPGCGCMPTAPFEQFCNDGRDDDCNGLIDCGDFACQMRPECRPFDGGPFRDAGPVCSFPENCHNGIDDDCNGPADCMDPFCIMTDPSCRPMCMPTSPFERRCTDGLDDDCDGQIDCADRDCRGRAGCQDAGSPPDSGPLRDSGGTFSNELGVAMCTNGIDDDRDGRADCLDPDCRPFGPTAECCNGIDDTGDGIIDEFTCRCFDNSFCPSVGSLDQVCWTSSFSVCAPRCNFYGGNSFCMMNLPGTPTCNFMTGECQ